MAELTAAFTIRAMRAADVPGADRLREQAGWNQSPEDWQRVLAWESEGCFVAEREGQIVGTVTSTVFSPRLAWIGMMLVDTSLRRHGIGRGLLQHAITWLEEVRRVESIGLDATPIGKTLYDTMAFVDAYTLHRREATAPEGAQASGVRPLTAADLETVAALDRGALGVVRGRLLADLVHAQPGGCFVVEVQGEVHGYVCSRPGARRWHIGPLVARDAASAEQLVLAVLAQHQGQPMVMDTPDDNDEATRLAEAFDFRPVRPFIRMVRGAPMPPADIQCCFATVGPEVG